MENVAHSTSKDDRVDVRDIFDRLANEITVKDLKTWRQELIEIQEKSDSPLYSNNTFESFNL